MAASDETLLAALEAMVARAATVNGTKWAGEWAGPSSYSSKDLVAFGGATYMSLVNNNRNNRPSRVSTKWQWIDISVLKVTQSIVSVSATETPAPNRIPQSNNDGVLENGWLPPGLNGAEQYVSPDGDDENDGLTSQTAKQHGYNAMVAIVAAGGGTIYVADQTNWGGPSNVGIQLRGDGFTVPGWTTCPPIHFVGCGQTTGGVFMTGVCATIIGVGCSDRLKPYLWITATANPVTFENIVFRRSGGAGFTASQPVKLGLDVDRNPDGSMKLLTVTNATRTGTSTVLTVTLPATGYATTTASRTSNVVTLNLTNPGIPFPALRIGTPFHLTSGNANFPTGDYVVTDIEGSHDGLTNPTWLIRYANVGNNQPLQAISGDVKTHGCQTGDMLELVGTNEVEFLSTMYRVTSSTVGTVTIFDSDANAVGNANKNNPGQLVRYEMGNNVVGTTTVTFKNVSTNVFAGNKAAGPGVLIGRNLAIAPTFYDSYTEGLIGSPVIPLAHRDSLRMAQILAYPGVEETPAHHTATGWNLYRHTGTTGSIVGYAGQGIADFNFKQGTIEFAVSAPVQDLALPGVIINGGPFAKVLLEDVQTPDSFGAGSNCVELYDTIRSSTVVNRCGPNPVLGACIGGDSWWSPGAWGAGTNTPTPWAAGHTTYWADGRLAAKHPGVVRAAGPVSARFKNIIAAPSAWGLRGSTVTENTTDVLAPNGSQTATKLVSAGDFLSIFPNAVTGDAWEAGGKFFVGGWINATSNVSMASGQFVWANTGNVEFATSSGGSNGALKCPYQGTGWQYISLSLDVVAVAAPDPVIELEMLFAGGATVYLWGLTAYYIKAGIGGNDAYEHLGTAPAQPRYLLPGMAGTFESQKFVAHGGIGTGTTYVEGAGAGQLTVVGSYNPKRYEPIYTAAGVLKGWAELINATVNP